MPTRSANARWNGDLKSGEGTMRFGGGAFEGAYSFRSRFEEGEGTNPEELIAAAHAGCFSMAFADELAGAGHDPQSVETEARVHLTPGGDGPPISKIELHTTATVPGIDEDEFQRIAEQTKEGCPVSQALAAVPEISLAATLSG